MKNALEAGFDGVVLQSATDIFSTNSYRTAPTCVATNMEDRSRTALACSSNALTPLSLSIAPDALRSTCRLVVARTVLPILIQNPHSVMELENSAGATLRLSLPAKSYRTTIVLSA